MDRSTRLLIPLFAVLPLAGVSCDDSTGDDADTGTGTDDTGGADVGGTDAGGEDTSAVDSGTDTLESDTTETTDTDDQTDTGNVDLGEISEEVEAFALTYCENSSECYAEYFSEYYDSVDDCVAQRTASFGDFVANETSGTPDCVANLGVLLGCQDEVWQAHGCDDYLPDYYCEDEYAAAADSCGFEFTCEDGSGIDWRLECDGIDNCPDGSDEVYCDEGSGEGSGY